MMANSCDDDDDDQLLSAEGIRPSKVSRDYLHSNSTSHTWPFSAIAELIDNAYDPGVDAKRLDINVEEINGTKCLSFIDDGSGMTQMQLHKMLSFGFCEKYVSGDGGRKKARSVGSSRSHVPLGQYGNGFKSGSMRLGRDAIVFTKCSSSSTPSSSSSRSIRSSSASSSSSPSASSSSASVAASSASDAATMSVGLLSQTFLEDIKAETVLLPIVTWKQETKDLMQSDRDRSLAFILSHSILFSSEEELFDQFDGIKDKTGTKIIVYNLKQGSDALFELDLDTDREDILNPETTEVDAIEGSDGSRELQEQPICRKSLRDYCSMLFLSSRMLIFLRGKEVKSKRPYEKLIYSQSEKYTPKNQKQVIKMTFGRWSEEGKRASQGGRRRGMGEREGDYGVLFYYKNRLIKAYEKVGCQKKGSGIGVVGIVDIPPDIENIVPIHNKQDFLQTNRFSSLMKELTRKLNIYCKETTTAAKITGKKSVVCDGCHQKRYLPDDYELDESDDWFCHMNPDSSFNRCELKEEPSLDLHKRTKKSKRQTSTASNRTNSSPGDPSSPSDGLPSSPSGHRQRRKEAPFGHPSTSPPSTPPPSTPPPSTPPSASVPSSVFDTVSVPAPLSVSVSVSARVSTTVSVSAPVSIPTTVCATVSASVPPSVSNTVPAPASVLVPVPVCVSSLVSVPAPVPVPASVSAPVSATPAAIVSASLPPLPPHTPARGSFSLSSSLPLSLPLSPVPAFTAPNLSPLNLHPHSTLSLPTSAIAPTASLSSPTDQPTSNPPAVRWPSSSPANTVNKGVNTISELHLRIESMADESESVCRKKCSANDEDEEKAVCTAEEDSKRSIESRSVQTETMQMVDTEVDATDDVSSSSSIEKQKLLRLRLNVSKHLLSLLPQFHFDKLEEVDDLFETFVNMNDHRQNEPTTIDSDPHSPIDTKKMIMKRCPSSPVITLDTDSDDDDDVTQDIIGLCSLTHWQMAPALHKAPAASGLKTIPPVASATMPTAATEQSNTHKEEMLDQLETTWVERLERKKKTDQNTSVQHKKQRTN